MKLTIKNLHFHFHYHGVAQPDGQVSMERAAKGEVSRSAAYEAAGVDLGRGQEDAETVRKSVEGDLDRSRAQQELAEEIENETNTFPSSFAAKTSAPPKSASDIAMKIPAGKFALRISPSGVRYLFAQFPPYTDAEVAEAEACPELLLPLSEFFEPLLCRGTTKMLLQVPGLDVSKHLAKVSIPSKETGRLSSTLCGTEMLVEALMGMHRRSLVKQRITDDEMTTINRRFDVCLDDVQGAARTARLSILGIPYLADACQPKNAADCGLRITDLYNLHPQVPRDFLKDFLARQGVLLRKALKWGNTNLRCASAFGLRNGYARIEPVNCEMKAKAGDGPGEGREVRYDVFFTDKTVNLLDHGPGGNGPSGFIEREYMASLHGAKSTPPEPVSADAPEEDHTNNPIAATGDTPA